MLNASSSLKDLRASFLATSSQSMPIAGMIYWGVIGIAALHLSPIQLMYTVGFGSGMIFPLAILIDRLRGRKFQANDPQNPVPQLFMQTLGMVALLWPFVIVAAIRAHDANLLVLGASILMGIIWIPYGWAADDPTGLRHAVARCILSYAAYLLIPIPYKASAISVVVLLCYLYSLLRMRKSPNIKHARSHA